MAETRVIDLEATSDPHPVIHVYDLHVGVDHEGSSAVVHVIELGVDVLSAGPTSNVTILGTDGNWYSVTEYVLSSTGQWIN